MAKHVFSLPVHNALSERQFIVATLYLDPNMSGETNEAIQLFLQNVVHERMTEKPVTVLLHTQGKTISLKWHHTQTPLHLTCLKWLKIILPTRKRELL